MLLKFMKIKHAITKHQCWLLSTGNKADRTDANYAQNKQIKLNLRAVTAVKCTLRNAACWV